MWIYFSKFSIILLSQDHRYCRLQIIEIEWTLMRREGGQEKENEYETVRNLFRLMSILVFRLFVVFIYLFSLLKFQNQ